MVDTFTIRLTHSRAKGTEGTRRRAAEGCKAFTRIPMKKRTERPPNERDLQIGIDHSDHWYLQFKVVSLLRRGVLRSTCVSLRARVL